MLTALDQGLSEQSQTNRAGDAENSLKTVLISAWNENTRDQLQIRILARLGYPQALARARALASDATNAPAFRAAMLQTYAEATKPDNATHIHEFIRGTGPDELSAAFAA